MTNQDFENKSSGSGLIPGFLAGAILTGALSVLIYKKDKGKTFEEIIDKIEKLISDYTCCEPATTPKSTKKTVEIPPEIIPPVKPKPPKPKTFKR